MVKLLSFYEENDNAVRKSDRVYTDYGRRPKHSLIVYTKRANKHTNYLIRKYYHHGRGHGHGYISQNWAREKNEMVYFWQLYQCTLDINSVVHHWNCPSRKRRRHTFLMFYFPFQLVYSLAIHHITSWDIKYVCMHAFEHAHTNARARTLTISRLI